MKVLVISSYSVLGGAELATTAFLAHRPAGVEATALLLGSGPLASKLAEIGVPSWGLPHFQHRPGVRDTVSFTRTLQAHLRDIQPDVVWAVGLKAAALAAPACRRRRTPLVWHKVDFSLDRVITIPLALAVDGIVAVSAASVGILPPALRRRRVLGIVGPPIRLADEFSSSPNPQRAIIGTLGTLTPIKGHHHLITAAARLSEQFPELEVLIGGSPSPVFPGYAQQLRDLASRHGMTDRVRLLGMVDPGEVLKRLNVYVNATYQIGNYGREGLSGAMLEASWSGIPIVATNGGGTNDGLIPGETGLLVPPADPDALAAAVATYLSDPDLAARVGAHGRRFARQFAAPVGAARVFELLGRAARSR